MARPFVSISANLLNPFPNQAFLASDEFLCPVAFFTTLLGTPSLLDFGIYGQIIAWRCGIPEDTQVRPKTNVKQ